MYVFLVLFGLFLISISSACIGWLLGARSVQRQVLHVLKVTAFESDEQAREMYEASSSYLQSVAYDQDAS
jgi:hypothetical protein